MTNNEKSVLRKLINDQRGLLSPVDLINGIANHDRRVVEALVAKRYIEEVPQIIPDFNGGHTVNFYRATQKAYDKFAPWYNRIWQNISSDLRTIIVSAVVALVTTLITKFIFKQ